jgi:excisionase family DNA binding protein
MEKLRFLTPADAAEVLNTSVAQVMALIKDGDLLAIQIGGRRQWRIEADQLEDYIQREYAKARAKQGSRQETPEQHHALERD